MHPSRRNTSKLSSELHHIDAGGTICQDRLILREQVADHAYGVLLIGSHTTIEKPIIGLRERWSYQPHIHSSFAMPTDTVLARIRFVYGYDLEDERRVDQLHHCCKYQWKHGGIQTIFALVSVLDVDLAERLQGFGVHVVGVPKVQRIS